MELGESTGQGRNTEFEGKNPIGLFPKDTGPRKDMGVLQTKANRGPPGRQSRKAKQGKKKKSNDFQNRFK